METDGKKSWQRLGPETGCNGISSIYIYLKPVLLKQVSNKQELTNWENILITKNKDRFINFEIPLADHLTKNLILNPAAPTRIPNQHQSVVGWQWKRFPYIHVSDVLCYKPISIIKSFVLWLWVCHRFNIKEIPGKVKL